MSSIKYGSKPLFEPTGKTYFVGDVHNCAEKLVDLLDKVEPLLTPEDHLVFLGDIIDRGDEPALTIEILVDLVKRRPTQVYFVRGNHEAMLMDYLSTGSPIWMQYLDITLQGLKTSWGLPDTLPATITQALIDRGFKEVTSRTVPYYETAEVIATHAPLNPDEFSRRTAAGYMPENFEGVLDSMKDSILWDFCSESLNIPEVTKYRVCGHQAGRHVLPRVLDDRAFIDTGAGLRPNGRITCFEWPNKKTYQSS